MTKEHMDDFFEDGRKVFKEMKGIFYPQFSGIRWKRYDPETGAILDLCWKQMKKSLYGKSCGIESPNHLRPASCKKGCGKAGGKRASGCKRKLQSKERVFAVF